MFLPFEKMPSYSRLWIYQSDRELTSNEVLKITDILTNFVGNWESHGNSLISSFEIRHQRFLILTVNEELTKATGCSIDKSVGLMKAIEAEFKISLFDRTKVVYFDTENKITMTSLSKIKELVIEEKITADTIIFDNLVQVKEQLDSEWQTKASNTWLKRYFQNVIS
ncbi:hypothetical protein Fleli_2735 [Bernardetia litoralis DSM 6794]|uniref:ABC transporter ATPase n=1 Tax=Bernardetia litoralis (strain ATCC 23117 / DSM 6794 / NBRC 15988 / NCIMB 1366 / Fx l1 / Sio-4) TaxID=880071 RepID=I4AMA4_BERLS|nr:hypothetical protein [Bernardetia litoralis]AFM05089.1 hypothetical protein Fleli_2735 [Bernardetia litoralis DSM 6794]